jgi:iron complex transport system permease protein
MTETAEETSVSPAAEPQPGLGILSVLGVLWLAATMWSAGASIAGRAADPAVVISMAALQLPVVIASTVLAGAATGLLATGRLARRLAVGLAAGAACGLLSAAVIMFGLGANWAVGVLAITVGVAGIVGGATAALPVRPRAAGIAATLSAFVAGALINLFQSPLKSLLGSGATIASQVAAADRLRYAAALASGVVAGLVAYSYLRRRAAGETWPWYLLAGATPGLILLVGEAFTRIGGAGLLAVVEGFSRADRDVVTFLGSGRLASALIIGFTGGIAAMIAIGRTLKRPVEA